MSIEKQQLLLVEDHQAFALQAQRELLQHSLIAQVWIADSLEAARIILAEQSITLCVIDLHLPDGQGTELVREIAPQVPCLILTVASDERTVLNAIAAGASGYLVKDGQPLSDRILAMLQGEFPISARVAAYLVHNWRKQTRTGSRDRTPPGTSAKATPSAIAPQLSARELEVLAVLAEGHTYEETGRLMSISHHTVADHIKNIYRKLAVNSRSAAVYQATKQGLLALKH